ncbi:MAG: isoprenyl transferase [Candidatus Omnitrophica bacterium]|nr:isoprenyl transferase [Candidatus Omnitrophota bacterium]
MIDKNNIPQHIAIIMDGNGRWARARSLSRTAGHREGVKRVKEIIRAAAESGVKIITLFAFSAENWSRPKKEIGALMHYLHDFLSREIRQLHKKNIRFLSVGRAEPLPASIQKEIREAERLTKNNTGLTVVLALNYGARQEIVDAVKKFANEALAGKAEIKELDEAIFGRYLYTVKLTDPDLLIRTSGEKRLSNFLLWQLSYAELYFTDKFWPDFRAGDLKEAIQEYQSRERRFGGLQNVN